jgi:hypothetical protein
MLNILQMDGPETALLESVDLYNGDKVPGKENPDLEFNTVQFREASYTVAIQKLVNKYQELLVLLEIAAKKAVNNPPEFGSGFRGGKGWHGISDIRRNLTSIPAGETNDLPLVAAIIWRVRPSVTPIKNAHGTLVGYQARFRCAVIPDLEEDTWEDFLAVPNPGVPADCQKD